MPKQRTYCFTALSEMRGLIAPSSWAQRSMRAAINVGTGPWFCLFVDGQFRASAEMGKMLVRIGFEYAYEFTKQDSDAWKLAHTALSWRRGLMKRTQVDSVLIDLQSAYGRHFESMPLIVARRLSSDNPCTVASAACIDAVEADHEAIRGAVIDYARRIIRS
jgi:hypothetical protein